MILLGRVNSASCEGKPRASGDDPYVYHQWYQPRLVNPARAGMILIAAWRATIANSKPRASGDDPIRHKLGRSENK